jgi:plasmid segregation protein ParM
MKSTPFTIGARSVDVGYYNVKYTLGRVTPQSAQAKVATFPSIAPVLRTGSAREAEGMREPQGCVVDVQGVSYFVGPGAAHRSNGTEARLVKEDYAASDTYLALLRGALWHIAKDATPSHDVVIRRLGLGLPLNTYHEAAKALRSRAVGEHIVGAGLEERRVTVEQARVMVQPQGAIVHFGYTNGGKPLEGVAMVIDPGGGTLDWYLAEGTSPNWERSGAYPKAMLACAYAVADRIDSHWRSRAAIIDRIDRAIREQRPSFTVQGRDFQMSQYRPAVDQVLDEAMDQMLAAVGTLDDVDHLLFTGGGASVFCSHLHKRHPRLKKISRLDADPIFSNVRGFQVVAESDLAAATAS